MQRRRGRERVPGSTIGRHASRLFNSRLFKAWLLGAVSPPAVVAAGTVLLLSALGYRDGLWLLLWVPVYALILFSGSQRLTKVEEHATRIRLIRCRDQQLESLEEHDRLKYILDALEDRTLRTQVDTALAGLGRVDLRQREEWQLLVINPLSSIVKAGTIKPWRRAILHPASLHRPYPGLVIWADGETPVARYLLASAQDEPHPRLESLRLRAPYEAVPLSLPTLLHRHGFPVDTPTAQASPSPQFATVATCVLFGPNFQAPTAASAMNATIDTRPLFIHRVVVDDRGNPLWLALADRSLGKSWGNPLLIRPPALHHLISRLCRVSEANPLVWCCTSAVPFSHAPLPLVDVPIPYLAIATLWIDPFTPCRPYKLFVPRRSVDFDQMVSRLQLLWETTLRHHSQGDFLAFVRDAHALRTYFERKYIIMHEHFLIHEGNLEDPASALPPQPTQPIAEVERSTPVAPTGHSSTPVVQTVALEPRAADILRLTALREKQKVWSWVLRLIGAGFGIGVAFITARATPYGVIHEAVRWSLVGDLINRFAQLRAAGLRDGVQAMQRVGLGFLLLSIGLQYAFYRMSPWQLDFPFWGVVVGSYIGYLRWSRKVSREVFLYALTQTPVNCWPLYRNDEWKLVIRVPPGLRASRDSRLALFVLLPDKASFNLVVGEYKAPATPHEYREEVKRALDAYIHPPFSYLERLELRVPPPENLRTRGVPYAIEAVYSKRRLVNLQIQTRRYMKFAFPRGGLEYVFTYQAPARAFSLYEGVVRQCLGSLEFDT